MPSTPLRSDQEKCLLLTSPLIEPARINTIQTSVTTIGGRLKSVTTKPISRGAVHAVPADLRKVLISDAAALAKWEDITPLARNEWICWVISVKKLETRKQHIERVRTELKEGMRRPCCWPGCPHR